MEFPSRTVMAQKNLFNVNTCKIYWQDSGDHLCVMVERLGKGKAPKKFYNFEVFRVTEKDVPTEVLKMDVPIVDFAWEPRGTRFIVIHGENARPDISVYSMSGEMMKQIGETLESKPANHIYWAPQGQFCVFAGLQSPALNGVLEFWDINAMELMGYQEHLMCTNVAWDPTGRYVSTFVSVLRQTVREQIAPCLLASSCCFIRSINPPFSLTAGVRACADAYAEWIQHLHKPRCGTTLGAVGEIFPIRVASAPTHAAG